VDFFQETTFRPLGGGAAPWNFYTSYNPYIVFPVGLGALGSLKLGFAPYL